jgi:hypothetical protein
MQEGDAGTKSLISLPLDPCQKTGDLRAPTSANKGPTGTGAVDWLQLQDKGGSRGITEVYRVVTAGGAAPAVYMATGIVSVPYCCGVLVLQLLRGEGNLHDQ